MGDPKKLPVATDWNASSPLIDAVSRMTSREGDERAISEKFDFVKPSVLDAKRLAKIAVDREEGISDFHAQHHRSRPGPVRTKAIWFSQRPFNEQIEQLKQWETLYKVFLRERDEIRAFRRRKREVEKRRNERLARVAEVVRNINSIRNAILRTPKDFHYLSGKALRDFRARKRHLVSYKKDDFAGWNFTPLKKHENYFGLKFEGAYRNYVSELYFSRQDSGVTHYWSASPTAVFSFTGPLRADIVYQKTRGTARWIKTYMDLMTYALPGAGQTGIARTIIQYGQDQVLDKAVTVMLEKYDSKMSGGGELLAATKSLMSRKKGGVAGLIRRRIKRTKTPLADSLDELSEEQVSSFLKYSDDIDSLKLLENPPPAIAHLSPAIREKILQVRKVVQKNDRYFAKMYGTFGLKPSQVRDIATITGVRWSKNAADPLIKRIAEIWEQEAKQLGNRQAREKLMTSLSKRAARRKFNNLRRKVFKHINTHDSAADVRRMFMDRGFTIAKRGSKLPTFKLPAGQKTLPTKSGRRRNKIRLSIDHIDELSQSAALGLEADNMRIEFLRSNTVLLNQVERRHIRMGEIAPSSKLANELIQASGKAGTTTLDLSKFDEEFMAAFSR